MEKAQITGTVLESTGRDKERRVGAAHIGLSLCHKGGPN